MANVMTEYIIINKKYADDMAAVLKKWTNSIGVDEAAEYKANEELQRQYLIIANVCLRAAHPEIDTVPRKDPLDYLPTIKR